MANVTYTVPNKNGSYDGDMVVKQYTTVNIDSGDTVTTDQPCRGMFLLSTGNFTVDGTLSMRSRGAFANPTTSGGSDSNAVDSNGLRFPFLTSGGSSSLTAANTLLNGCGTTARSVIANFKTLASNGTILTVVRQGANGGASITTNTSQTSNGNNGSNGSTGQSGGGASGASNYNGTCGSGSYGSCFSGGSGGGAIDDSTGGNYGGVGGSTTSATAWGGAGGNSGTGHSSAGSGGAGNPKGNPYDTSGSIAVTSVNADEGNGTGGLIIIVCGGNVTVGSNGKITAEGGRSNHVVGANDWLCTAGAAGGGNIIIAHKGTYTNNGTVTAAGGESGKTWSNSVGGSRSNGTYKAVGGNGGNGSVQILQIS
tara:strand:- start:532 stop:1632 length:1101 start_codon:yes stop_codon:yes gene_type:complete